MRIRRIIQKFEKIHENLERIEKYLPNTYTEFEVLEIVKDGIYKRLEYSIELLVDICSIINSDLQLGLPNGENDLIDNLVSADIISIDHGQTIRQMKGLRNILVHRYGGIDDELVYQFLSEDLNDFKLIEKEIMSYIKQYNREI